MENQRQAAAEAMIDWLADKRELGRAPARIKCAGQFDLHGLHYYIFKYKKSMLGQWLIGVCGGYMEEDTEHCGHVFSKMEKYSPATAMDKCIAMVEMIREYWMKQAEEHMPDGDGVDDGGQIPAAADDGGQEKNVSGQDRESKDPFGGFVLLASNAWDVDKLKRDLQEDWGITVPIQQKGKNTRSKNNTTLIWEESGMTAAISLMPAPVPEGEAEQNAAHNFFWPEAVEITQGHKAHILVAVLPGSRPAAEAGKLYVKLCASCSRQDNALGIYTSGTVFQPDFYQKAAGDMKDGDLPILNWIHFGLWQSEKGMNAYTYGMDAFGKKELEVLDSRADPQDLYGFLVDIASYVLISDVTLRHGETIGFTEDEKLPITCSKGVSVDGDSLKIGYKPAL